MSPFMATGLSKWVPLRDHRRRERAESGDTLIEVLLALVILVVAALAIMVALLTSLSSSATYRKLATFDTVLRSAASEATAQIQSQSAALWGNCGGAGQVVFTLPTGYTAVISTTTYWNGAAFVAACQANAPQLITITVTATADATTRSVSTVLYDPLTRSVPPSGAATHLVFIGQPADGIVGLSLSPPPVVAVEDAAGNVVTTDLSPVHLSITAGSGTGGAALSSNCTGGVFYGVDTFSNCSINLVGNNYTLTATLGTFVTTSTTFNISPLVASKLVIVSSVVTGPASLSATLGPITVQEQDISGNPVPAGPGGLTVNLSSSSTGLSSFAASASGTNTTTVTIPAGLTSTTFFYGDTQAKSQTVTASAIAMAKGTQKETITVGPIVQIGFVPPNPGPGVAGAALPNVSVAVEDAFANVVTSKNSGTVTVSIVAGSPQGTFTSGTTTATVTNGVATFANLVVRTAGNYVLSAAPSAIAGASGPVNSGSLLVTAGAPSKLLITTPPASSITAGQTVGLGVTIEDAFNNIVTTGSAGSTDNLKVTLSSGNFGAGATTVAASNGVATFAGLQITTAGSLNITASDVSSAGVATANTGAINVAAGPAAQLAISTGSFTMTATNSATRSFTVTLEDSFGNATTVASATTVNLSSNSAGARFAASSGGASAATVTVAANTASVNAFYGDTVTGSPTVTVAASGYTGDSQLETVTGAAPSKLAITSLPFTTTSSNSATQPFTITLEDTFGNPTTSGSSITVNLTSTSAGRRFSASSGGASVTRVTLAANTTSVIAYYGDSTVGTPTLTASAAGLSNGTQIETVNLHKLVITTAAFTVTAGNTATKSLTIQLQTGAGVAATNASATTLNLSTSSAGGIFSTASGGVSTTTVTLPANTSSVNVFYGDTRAGFSILSVSSPSVTTGSQIDTVNAAAATQLAITSVAFTTGASASATQPFTVTLEDAFGNAATIASATTVNLSSTSAGAKFAASSGGVGVTLVTIAANTSSVVAYYGDSTTGSPTITVAATGRTSGTQSESVV